MGRSFLDVWKLSGIVSCDAAAIRIRLRIARCQQPAKRQNTNLSREKNPPQKPPTPIKRVCVNSFRDCSCKLSSLFPLNKTRGTQKEFGQIVCPNCFQLGLLGWVVFWGGFFSLEPCETQARFLPPLLLVGSKELVLKVPKQGQFHVAIRVTIWRCDSCAQGALGRRTVPQRNSCDAESLAKRCGETCH